MSLKQDWNRLLHGRAGHRFVDFHQERCKRRAGGWPRERVVTLVLGIVLLVGGLAIGWLPGPGGFVAVIGAAMLGIEWLWVAKLLDRAERLLRRAWRFLRARIPHRRPSEP